MAIANQSAVTEGQGVDVEVEDLVSLRMRSQNVFSAVYTSAAPIGGRYEPVGPVTITCFYEIGRALRGV